MKKIITSSLISLLTFSLITACSNSQANLPALEQNVNISSAANDVSNQYIVTAQSIIDKMPKVTTVAEQEKLVKDFTPLVKNLNRFAIDKLIKYAVKVLQDNLKPGEQPNQTATAKLIYPMLNRILDITQKASFAHVDVIFISEETDPAKQAQLISKFEQTIKKLVKADIKGLIGALKGENGNLNDFVPVGSELSNKLLRILEARL